MLRRCLLIIATLLFAISTLAQKLSIAGYVQDSLTGERLVGASVYVPASKTGTTTNSFGYFNLHVPDTTALLVTVSYMGYRTATICWATSKDAITTLRLQPQSSEIDEVAVYANHHKVQSTRTDFIELPLEKIKAIPALLGEHDLLKSLLTLPGVQFATEGTSNISIRGGSPEQNLVLVDDVPVYNSNHLMGIFSTYNTDALKSATLLKGGFPAQYGGRTSSVLDMRMKEGNNQEYHGIMSLGILSSRFMVEGPILKNKLSFIVTGRRSFADLLANPFIAMMMLGEREKMNYNFYFFDITGKVNYTLSDRDRLYASFFMSRDPFSISSKLKTNTAERNEEEVHKWTLKYANKIGSLRWNHVMKNGIFANTTLLYSRYNFSNTEFYKSTVTVSDSTSRESFNLGLSSGLTDLGVKVDFDLGNHKNHKLKTGADATFHQFEPGVEVFYLNDAVTSYNLDSTQIQGKNRSLESSVYVEDEVRLGKRISANLGYRLTVYSTSNKNYVEHQPRFSARWLLSNNLSAKASAVRIHQNLHLLSNSGISLPTDLWVPVTNLIKPVVSDQASAGITCLSANKKYEFTLEGFYKTLSNVIEYKEGASFVDTTSNWEHKVEAGRGEAYGVELMAEKKTGKLQGWISYTWSKTVRQFENISYGRVFPYKYDRRHNFSVTAIYQLKPNRQLNLNWMYASGNPVTFAFENYNSNQNNFDYLFQGYLTPDGHGNNQYRNNYRFPAYHRLDIGYTITKIKTWGSAEWNLGLYNAYNRHNAFYLYQHDKKLYKVSLLPIVPSVSYTIKF